jgi:rfaE bifunctional protein nucleotidyltransferase chain/domain
MLDLNDKNLLVVADENRAAAVGWKDSANFDGQNITLHAVKLRHLPQKNKHERMGNGATCRVANGLPFDPKWPAMSLANKILSAPDLARWRDVLRRAGKKLVVTNGCFDLLHLGHVTYLEQASRQGDALLVGVTNDAGVRALKGAGRPLNTAEDRAAVLAALQSVDAVHIFPELDARAFLKSTKPDVYVKGGDYTLDTINQDERRLLEELGVKIVLLPVVPGKSTSALLEKIHRL